MRRTALNVVAMLGLAIMAIKIAGRVHTHELVLLIVLGIVLYLNNRTRRGLLG